MKNETKNKIKIISTAIASALIAGTISVYAATTIMANQIEYIKADNSKMLVSDALNDLYSKLNVSNYYVGIFDGWKKNATWLVGGLERCNGIDTEYLNYNSEDKNVTVKKRGRYNIKIQLVNTGKTTSGAQGEIMVNNVTKLTATNTINASDTAQDEVTLNLEVDDLIDLKMKGGDTNITYFITTINFVK